MKIDGRVLYTDKSGKVHDAVITALTGNSASGYKTLNLRYTSRKSELLAENVVHEQDHANAGYWK